MGTFKPLVFFFVISRYLLLGSDLDFLERFSRALPIVLGDWMHQHCLWNGHLDHGTPRAVLHMLGVLVIGHRYVRLNCTLQSIAFSSLLPTMANTLHRLRILTIQFDCLFSASTGTGDHLGL